MRYHLPPLADNANDSGSNVNEQLTMETLQMVNLRVAEIFKSPPIKVRFIFMSFIEEAKETDARKLRIVKACAMLAAGKTSPTK